jgi:hypothetical protein
MLIVMIEAKLNDPVLFIHHTIVLARSFRRRRGRRIQRRRLVVLVGTERIEPHDFFPFAFRAADIPAATAIRSACFFPYFFMASR